MEEYLWDDVTGETYANALSSMTLINNAINDRFGKGFDSWDDCATFAAENNLGVMAYSPSTKGFYHVTHKGELLADKAWFEMYGSILYYTTIEKDKVIRTKWAPKSFESRNGALLVSETGNGVRAPLYERNYFVPTGYRNPINGLWNVAKPFNFFAKETGADTSHIYTLLQHISGENYPYLLAWLRHKMIHPKKKTEVVPIFIGAQGSGKSTFGEVICRAMFGKDNTLVTHSFNGSSRFNTDQTDVLVVSIEEKSQDDKYNATSILKSLSTARTVRKEAKGVDPFYQESYTEYVLTTNDVVPIKFDSKDQRRFMVMRTDSEFVRKKRGERETDTSILADEIFTKIYGEDRFGNQTDLPLYEQRDVIQQFKWELLNNKELPSPRDFVETEAFKGMYNIPRTTEVVEIEALLQSLAPFIRESLLVSKIVDEVEVGDEDEKETIKLTDVTPYTDGILFVNRHGTNPSRIAINQMLIFRDDRADKPYSHASIAKVLADNAEWFKQEYNIQVLNTSDKPTNGGFKRCTSKYRLSPAIWFTLTDDAPYSSYQGKTYNVVGTRKLLGNVEEYNYQRYNDKFKPDSKGCFEVLNPLFPDMERNAENVMITSRFLLEADDAPKHVQLKEAAMLASVKGDMVTDAELLYKDRLDIQRAEGLRLMNLGIVQRMVYSGGKSIHLIVQVADQPTNKEERRWLDAYLKTTLSQLLVFDMSTSDAARLTRAPHEHLRTFEVDGKRMIGKQRLLRQNDNNIYDLKWRPLYSQWLATKRAMYEEGAKRKLLPVKPIYKDAAISLLDGTFWTDNKWDGQRNALFFIAYRLVRSMGHSFDVVWESIEEDIKGYYKQDEIKYWLTRKDGSFIKSIEEELGVE